MKLWDKGFDEDPRIDEFTVGLDRELDLQLAPFDILGNIAQTKMLGSVGLIPESDVPLLCNELKELYYKALNGEFEIEPDVEDIHSQVELMLTRKLGDVGKKIHTGRSRNDQVLLDLKLFTRSAIEKTVGKAKRLFDLLQARSEQSKDILMPGYTHLQVAMPSSFGMWFGAYAESVAADVELMLGAWHIADRNPLGSAAGYGSSAPIDRQMTTELLGFEDLDYNSVYAQMTRGRLEKTVATAYASLADTLSRFAYDCCLFNSQNFGFVKLPDSLTTGSSIMPHKKNPDVFELVRARCNRIQALPFTLRSICGNLPSGYFRDMQELKEVYFSLFPIMDSVLDILCYAAEKMTLTENLMASPLYQTAFSVEEANRLVGEGMPFRDAYRTVAADIASGSFAFGGELHHTHIGSIGNLCNERVAERMSEVISRFGFARVASAYARLLE